jgi:hypothetical protein
MSAVVAMGALAGMLAGVAVDAEVGASSEARVRSLSESNTAAPVERQTKASVVLVPSLTGILDVANLRATVAYAPRVWESDVFGASPILANHVLLGTLATRHEAAWRAEATVSATRGTVDPFSDPLRAAQLNATNAQATTTSTVSYEELVAGGQCQIPVGDRTTVFGSAGWEVTRPLLVSDRSSVPLQRSATVGLAVSHLVTERDTLRLDATGRRVYTLPLEGPRTADILSGGLNWRRVLAARYQAWLGAGATVARSGNPDNPNGWDRLPRAELGFAVGSEGEAVTGDAVARISTFVDRFTSEVKPMGEGTAGVRWQVGESLVHSTSVFVGFRLDGATQLGGGDTRLVWSLTPLLNVEGGLLVRAQRERDQTRPSFNEETLFVVVAYNSQRLLRTALP